MVLVHEKRSGLPSLPSRRGLCTDNGGSSFDSLKVQLMVLVHENGSGLPSLPSRRWLSTDKSTFFPLMADRAIDDTFARPFHRWPCSDPFAAFPS